jgi:hypothetical protein
MRNALPIGRAPVARAFFRPFSYPFLRDKGFFSKRFIHRFASARTLAGAVPP